MRCTSITTDLRTHTWHGGSHRPHLAIIPAHMGLNGICVCNRRLVVNMEWQASDFELLGAKGDNIACAGAVAEGTIPLSQLVPDG